ncbi:hypothetical protein SAMN05444411_1204 [Lutibacter oricola]|uniref:Uncharacterized protein n=1 Tax=Lutibacter oricola TaxID=762486 RepID=A0A1H3GZE5_9FLAO|nr:hypothetical protein [Lutibacter oricola]SDY07739.1 hypothetical protein SAMN05444411_1204 [Lutibacter oricola]
MKEKKIEYLIKDENNSLINSINEEIKTSIFQKRNNLSGEISDKGGLNIFKTFTFITDVQPNHNPIVKLNLKTVRYDNDLTNRKLILSKVKEGIFGNTFLIFIIFILLTLSIAIYQIIEYGFNEKMEFLTMPIAGGLFYIVYELISDFVISNLVKKVENIMTDLGIEYKKL